MSKAIIGSAWIVVLVLAAAAPAGAQDASPSPSAAAPQYQSSEPADGEQMHKPPERVSITFSEPLDSSSTLVVTDECGRQVDDGNVEIQVNEMSVALAETPSGQYRADYLAVGIAGVTGSTKGAVGFFVHLGPACDGSAGGHDHHEGGGGHDHHGGGGHDHHGTDHSGHSLGEHSTHVHSLGHVHTTGHVHGGEAHHHHDTGGAIAAGGPGEQKPKPLAASRFPLTDPDGSTVVAALAISLAVGVLGGFVLRVSNPS